MKDTQPEKIAIDPELSAALEESEADSNRITLTGKIVVAGPWLDGSFRVDFKDNSGKTWPSFWPEWTHKTAVTALTHDLTVVVVADGTAPWGSQLRQVLLHRI